MDNEVYQFDGERVLNHVIHIICEYLDIEGLSIVSKVCTFWEGVALREERKRYGIQQLRLPLKIDNLRSLLQGIPSVSLLIYDDRWLQSISYELRVIPEHYAHRKHFLFTDSYEAKLLEELEKQIPNDQTILLKVGKFLSTEDPEFQDRQEQCTAKPTRNYNILGFFIASIEQRFRVHISSFSNSDLYDICNMNPSHLEGLLNRTINELSLNDEEYSKSTILVISDILTTSPTPILLSALYKRLQQQGKQVFMNLHGGKFMITSRNTDIDEWDDAAYGDLFEGPIILRISGPTVHSCSTYIHYRAGHDEIERKLDALKKQVPSNRHYFGLLSSSSCESEKCKHIGHPCGDSHGMMRRLKQTFPHIRFTGIFNRCCSSEFTDIPDMNPDLSNDGLFSQDYFYGLDVQTLILIISYK